MKAPPAMVEICANLMLQFDPGLWIVVERHWSQRSTSGVAALIGLNREMNGNLH